MEDMGSEMTNNQFMMHILNNLTKDYKMQVLKLKDRIRLSKIVLDCQQMVSKLRI
jgi:hypothetical protein